MAEPQSPAEIVDALRAAITPGQQIVHLERAAAHALIFLVRSTSWAIQDSTVRPDKLPVRRHVVDDIEPTAYTEDDGWEWDDSNVRVLPAHIEPNDPERIQLPDTCDRRWVSSADARRFAAELLSAAARGEAQQ